MKAQYLNSPQLRKWLENSGLPELSTQAELWIDADLFNEQKDLLATNKVPAEHLEDRAAFRCLTLWKEPEPATPTIEPSCSNEFPSCTFVPQPEATVDVRPIVDAIDRRGKRIERLLIAIAAILLILFASSRAHAQQGNVNPAIVVATCGTPPAVYPGANGRAPETVDVNGNLCAGVTVSATISTAGLAVTLGAGTSGTGSGYAAATYNTSAAPAYTNGTFNSLSADLAGNLRVNATVTPAALQNVNVTQVGNTSVSAGLLAVVGAVSSGTAISGGPVLVSGNSGGTSTSLSISTTGGGVKVDPSGYTSPVSATSLPLPTGAATEVTLGTRALESGGNLATLAGTVTASRAAVNLISGQAGIAGGTGTDGATVPRVSLATNVPLPAGSNVIGHTINDTGSTTVVTGTTTIAGTLTNNNAVPGAVNVGVLPQLANAAVPTWTEGDLVLQSTTLKGYTRTTLPIITLAPYMNAAIAGTAVNAFATSGDVLDAISCMNSSTSANAFVQIFNTTAASVTPGSTSPTEQYMVPFGGGFVMTNMHTLYTNGISMISSTVASGGTGQAILCTVKAYVP